MRIAVVTLFPQMFAAIADYGITSRAIKQGLVELNYWNPREFTTDKHQTVDGRPYGGGPGMVMMVEPLRHAIRAAKTWAGEAAQVVYLSPQGYLLDQSRVVELAQRRNNLVLLAGRYEGVDERLIAAEVDMELSIGDYILSGGELAAMVLVDAVTRLMPGALGHSLSSEQDSFSNGLLDCPHFTRPEVCAGQRVPAVLLSGDHEQIRSWRLTQALGRTWERRPDLLNEQTLSERQKKLLAEFKQDAAQGAQKGVQGCKDRRIKDHQIDGDKSPDQD